MDNNKSAVEAFLGDLGGNKETNPFEENQENPFEQEVAPKEEVKEVVEEKPLPFNKDPKVLRFIEKELDKRSKERGSEDKPITKEVPQVDDDYYVRLIGNDTPEKVAMIKESIARDERMLSQAEERAFNRLSRVEQEKIMADKQAEEELENAFANIEETFDVDLTSNNSIAKKTRQEFVSFVEKIAPKDRNGDIVDYPDMASAWETFSELKKSTATPSRAKELANRSLTRSAETTTKPEAKVGWDSADAFIESFGK